MKVLFTTNIPSPYRINFFNELSNYCELTVVCERKLAKNRNKEWLDNKKIKFNIEFLNGINIGNDGAFCLDIIKFLKDESFDIIVIGGYSTPTGMIAIEWLKRHRKKFILNSDGGFIKEESKLKYKIKKYFISSAKAWLSTGDHTRKYLEHYGADRKNIYNYPFSSINKDDIIDINSIDKKKIKEQIGIKEEKIILSIGRMIYGKGFDILIKAMSEMNQENVGLYIIGGKPIEEYTALVEKLKLKNVHFIDFKQKKELSEFYEMADVFAFPTREDIWGLVVNEAMAAGLPVITTDRCIAGQELIENEINGYIIETNNVQQLKESIEKILNNDQLRILMAKNNIEKIKTYTIENMAIEHIKIFKKIIEEK